MKAVAPKAPGVVKFGPFGPYKNAVWLFHHGPEAAVVEMPPYKEGRDAKPWLKVKKFLKRQGMTLKYALLSHIHMDHCLTMGQFRLAFPETTFVGHRSHLNSPLTWRLSRSVGMRPDEMFDEVYDGDIKMLDLCGEPLLLIHCPKHSQTDQFVIFRGTAMTGDWFLGDLKDCNALVSPADKIRSVERVQNWLRRMNYGVSRAFSGHGDCLYYDVDFHRLMEKSKVDHDF
ncbi:MAG: MBL fold metallo-hydrolase [Candidatus Eremiobacteraeota bacterium]|nr:MBL fold metallo-hydrolase [Candidatus Eremiobacteraeota bacterium]